MHLHSSTVHFLTQKSIHPKNVLNIFLKKNNRKHNGNLKKLFNIFNRMFYLFTTNFEN